MKKLMMILGTLMVLIIVSGCSLVTGGSSDTEDILVKKDKAEELNLDLNFGAGKVVVTDGAHEWIEGEAEYTDRDLKPEVRYDLDGDVGKASIDQGNGKFGGINVGNGKNEWNIRLTEEIPIDLEVNSGASDTELNLVGVKLSNLEVNAGVGDMEIDLSGKHKESFDVQLRMGVGKSTIVLPEDVGVRIESSKGIGDSNFENLISEGNGVYVNKAYEDADVIIHIDMELGVGEVTFKAR